MTEMTATATTASADDDTPLRRFVAKSEMPMLVVAGVAVAIYIADVAGLFRAWGFEAAAQRVSFALDLAFVADLALKTAALGRAYLRTGWFFIDLVSTLPVLSMLRTVPSALRGLRIIRSLRVLRILRSLRSLRVLRAFRGLRIGMEEPRESPVFHRALGLAVAGYTAIVLGIAAGGDRLVAAGPHAPEIFLVVGSLLGMGLVMVVLRFQLPDLTKHQVRSLLNVALPEQVAARMMKEPEAYSRSVRMPGTVMFCDISGFTAAVEALGDDLDALKTNLEAALDAVVVVHLRHDLIIDKFIGDAVMSFRGGDMVEGTPAEHARRVVLAAVESARALAAAKNPYFKSMKIGGASAPDMLIGTFGTSRRLSYTVLGDRVNLASRLEGQCGKFGVANIFDDETRRLAGDPEGVVWRRIGRIRVQGKNEPIDVVEAVDATKDTAWVAEYERALAHFESRRFEEARDRFAAVDAARGAAGDGPARLYRAESERLLREGAPEGWEPILQTKKS